MAEQKLFKQLGEGNEPVSNVPATSEYTEKYDPSPIAGILGLTAAGAGAVALRTPIGRLINKTIKIKPPKLEVPRTTEPSDEVSGILATVPSKTQRAESVTSTAIDKVKEEAAQIKARSDELKKLAYQNPLTHGGAKNDGFGSSLWDYIARHPIGTQRKAKDWIRDFTSKGLGNFKTGNPNFKTIDQSVKRDELYDSNLLQLDKNGNVVGGFLKYADEKNLPLTKMDLLYIVNKAPINQLKTKRFVSNPELSDEGSELGSRIVNATKMLQDKLLKKGSGIGTEPPRDLAAKEAVDRMLENVRNIEKDVLTKNARMDRYLRHGNSSGRYDTYEVPDYADELDRLKNIKVGLERQGIELPPAYDEGLIDAIGKNTLFRRKVNIADGKGDVPKYGHHSEYRVPGGLNYFEDVTYAGKLPYNLRLPDEYNKHYSGLENNIYHVRGSLRHGVNTDQKILAIDEIQADYAQKLQKVDPTRSRVLNPYGTEVEFFSANRKIEDLQAKMKKIADKGRAMTREDIKEFYKLRDDFEEVKKNSLNMASIVERNIGAADDMIPFLPLYGKENWGAHAIKNTIKEAIRKGDADYIVINPVERLHHLKRTRYQGDIEFYGNSKGKAGFKDYGADDGVMNIVDGTDVPMKGIGPNKDLTDPKKIATLPNIMRKIANQYGSKAETIMVAKSDLTKPFKVIRKDKPSRNPQKMGISYVEADEHIGAFKTLDEAEAFAKEFNGTVKVMQPGDPRLYYEAFGLKITPDMKTKPFKNYNTGGLVVNIFA